MKFRCPQCQKQCDDVEAGSGVVQTKSDHRLLEADQKQAGLLVTAACYDCVLRFTFLLPVLSSSVREIQLEEERPRATVLSPKEAQRAGFTPGDRRN